MSKTFVHWLFGNRTKTGILLTVLLIAAFGVGVTLYFSNRLDSFVYDEIVSIFASRAQAHVQEDLIADDWIHRWKEPGSAYAFQTYMNTIAQLGGTLVRFNIYSPDAVVVWSSLPEDIGKTEEPENVAKTLGGQVFIEHAESTNKTVLKTGIQHLIEMYVPLKRTDGSVVGVTELYINVTREAALIETMQIAIGSSVFIGLALTFFLLYGAFKRQNKETEELVIQRTESLRGLQEQYQKVVEGSMVGIYTIVNGRFQFVNTEFVKIFGYGKSAELIGMPYQIIATKRGEEEILQSGFSQRLSGKGKPIQYVFHGKKKDGKEILIEVLSNPGKVDGKPAVIGSLRDVTGRVKSEEALRAARDEARQYLDVAEVLLVVTDLNMNVQMMNRKGAQILGVRSEDALGKNFVTSFYPKGDQAAVLQHFRAFIAGEAKLGEYHEAVQVSSTGERRTLAWHHALVRDGAGKIVGVLSSGEDITEKNRAQKNEQVQLKMTALLSQDLSFEDVAMRAQQLISEAFGFAYAENWMPDPTSGALVRVTGQKFNGDGNALSLSKGGKKVKFPFTEAERDRIFSRGALEWRTNIEKDPSFLKRAEAEADGIVSVLFVPYTLDEHTKGISIFYSREWYTPDANVIAVLTSIREQFVAFLNQGKAKQRIKELNELRNTFIQIVSHQLRTPLNAMRWNLEALLTGELGKLKQEQKEFVRITYLANTEVISRIHDLLTAMDIEEGRVMVSKSEGSIESLWNSVLPEWKRKCEAKDIRCTYEQSKEEMANANFDADKLREVFEKISSNSVDYTPAGGKVLARFRPTEQGIRFELSDTGIGIPTAEQPKIFTRFFRASNASTTKPDASGLGLAISKYYIEQHGGKIGFSSEEGKGSTFWFEIPIK